MSRRYTAASEDFNDPKIYVNNMNTPNPNVDLPNRPEKGRRRPADNNNNYNYSTNSNDTHTSTIPIPSAPLGTPTPIRVQSSTLNNNNSSVDKIDLHPNLEQSYKKIMRKLQKQLNYEEANKVSLAQQFGVAMELDQPEYHSKNNEDFLGETNNSSVFNTRATTPFSDTHTSLPDGNSNISPPRSAPTAAPLPLSNLVKYNNDSGDGNGVVRVINVEETDEEALLLAQPCPPTLRLVLQHVQEVLLKKLELAERGSLKECVQFTFEGKSLLERLLKEMPSYTQYFDAGAHNTVTNDKQQAMYNTGEKSFLSLSNKNQSTGLSYMQTILSESRKNNPTLLPKSHYVQEGSGAVKAVLDLTEEERVKQDTNAGKALPRVNRGGGGVQFIEGENMCGGTSRKGTGLDQRYSVLADELNTMNTGRGMPQVQLPETYAKSARIYGNAPGNNSVSASTTLPRNRSPLPLQHPVQPTSPVPDDGGEESVRSHMDDPSLGESLQPGAAEPVQPRPINRATQQVSVGTITEDNNNTNMIPIEEYHALEERYAELQVKLEESYRHKEALSDRLLEEGSYTERKARVIEYLRETLLKECNILRTQLSFAARKEQHLNQTLQQRGGNPTAVESGMFNKTNNNRSMMLGRSVASRSNVMGKSSRMDRSLGRSATQLEKSKSSEMMSAMNVQSVLGSLQREEEEDNNTTSSLSGAGVLNQDITSIQSLLDLALLAIETDQEITVSPETLRHVNLEDADTVMREEPRAQLERARMEFENKQRALKMNFLSAQMRHTAEVKEKDEEIKRLEKLSDIPVVRERIKESIGELRTNVRKVRNSVNEELRVFEIALKSTSATLLGRAKVMDKTQQENSILITSQEALFDMIASLSSLITPMLSQEYLSGYHPWPVKLRNSADPFAHLVQVRYGAGEVLRLRECLTILSDLYLSVHQCVMRQLVVPDMTRPATGKAFVELCWRLALHPSCSTETYYEIRQHHGEEIRLSKQIAKLHFQLLWNVYMQNTYSERSVNALLESRIDPHSINLPVSRRINQLGTAREAINRRLADLKKQRSDNARGVYKIWVEKGTDIYQGYPTPATGKQLNLLSDLQSSKQRSSIHQKQLMTAKSFSRKRKSLAAEEVALEQQWRAQERQEQLEKEKAQKQRFSHVEETLQYFQDDE